MLHNIRYNRTEDKASFIIIITYTMKVISQGHPLVLHIKYIVVFYITDMLQNLLKEVL